jgi:LCP family protein required for cell wall assembly
MKNPFKKEPDPLGAHGYDGVVKSASERPRPWLFRHRWAWISLLLVSFLVAAIGFGVYTYYSLQADIQVPIDGLDEVDEEDEPFNILLVGSDSREGLTEDERHELGADIIDETGREITDERADTLILGQIHPETNQVFMVQFPRDLYVPHPDGRSDKINEALEEGKNNLVATVEELTGLDIHRYAQVNIAGFRDIIDALGDVTLCLTEPIPFDPQTGIEVTEDELPLVEFDGERALRFVRSRNFPDGDFQRIQNQQKFLSAAVSKVTSAGTVLNPGRIRALLNAGAENVRVDRGTGVMDLFRIGQRFRQFDPERYEAYTLPNLGPAENEAGWVILPDRPAMKLMFEALANHESPSAADGLPAVAVSAIRVGIYNGSTRPGAAAEAAVPLQDALRQGEETIQVVDIADANRDDFRRTVVRFDPDERGSADKAQLIAAAIPGARLREASTPEGVDVAVIVGRRAFETERVIQLRPIELPPPGTVPEECR